MKLICLLPVRNGETDLPGFFESAARFADGVIALDDGSTDATPILLSREPLVVETLINPVRSGFGGWHDAVNRNRLLAAAEPHRPDWIISVDADERIDAADAEALRRFLETDALPGLAYGFRCFSMVGGLEWALPTPIWVYRLFAFAPGQRFPEQQLHFAPIPTVVPRAAFVRTSLRIQHLGGMSQERRLSRYEKYRQADPDCRYWPDYSGLLKEPDPNDLIVWKPREPGSPIVVTGDSSLEEATSVETGTATFDLTAVILNDGPVAGVQRAIESITNQDCVHHTLETIVVTRAGSPLSDAASRTITLQKHATRGAMRNAALEAANGRQLLFLDSDLALTAGALEYLETGFARGFASVTGSVIDRTEGRAKATFVDMFNDLQLGSLEAIFDSPVPWAAYSKSLLLELGGFDETLHGGEEIALGHRLAESGYVTLKLAAPVLCYFGDSIRSPGADIAAAFARGSALARYQLTAYAHRGELIDRNIAKRVRARRSASSRHAATGVGDTLDRLLISGGRTAGAWLELIRPRRGKATVLFGRPAGISLLVVRRSDGEPLVGLVRFDLNKPEIRIVEFPARLAVPSANGNSIELQMALGFGHGAGDVSRFAINDAVARPFDIVIDDVIVVEGSTDAGSMIIREAERLSRSETRSFASVAANLPTLVSMWRGSASGDSIQTTLSRRAIALALLRLNRMSRDHVHVIRPFGDGDVLDADSVEIVRSFLEPAEIKRPRTKFSTLREVEWA